MSVAVPPSTRNRADRPSEDELDEILRAFYKSELPNPWPALTVPAERNAVLPFRSAKPRFTMSRTRWALAACVAFLVSGTLIVSPFFNRANTETAVKGTEPDAPRAGRNGAMQINLIQKDGQTGVEVKIPYGPEK